MIVLNEVAGDAAGDERTRVERFREEPAIITKDLGCDQLHVRNRKSRDLHAISCVE
jgi:hypothetical protein